MAFLKPDIYLSATNRVDVLSWSWFAFAVYRSAQLRGVVDPCVVPTSSLPPGPRSRMIRLRLYLEDVTQLS